MKRQSLRRKNKTKKFKYKSKKRSKERKRKRTRKMKAGNIFDLLKKRERGSTRGISKQGITRKFLANTDGKQARINTIPAEVKSQIPGATGLANIRRRPKFKTKS